MLTKTRNDNCKVVYCWHVTLGLLNFVVLAVTVQSELKYASMHAKGDVKKWLVHFVYRRSVLS